MHKKDSSVTMLGAAGMDGYAMPPKEELVSHYVMFCWYAMLCFPTHKKELVRHRCYWIRPQSASGEDDEAFLVGPITMLFTRQDTISINSVL